MQCKHFMMKVKNRIQKKVGLISIKATYRYFSEINPILQLKPNI